MLMFAASGAADDVDDLVSALSGDNNAARMDAAKNAGPIGPAAIERVGKLVASEDYLVARASKLALERIVAAAGAPGADTRAQTSRELIKLAQPEMQGATRREAIHLLGWIGGPDNVTAIAELLTDPDIADGARMALQRIPGDEVALALLAAAPLVDAAIQPGIFYAMGQRGVQDAIPILMEVAKSDDREKSWMAFDILTRLGVAPLQIMPRTHAKELAGRKRYASGFLRAADTKLAQGQTADAEKMYASIAAFPISPQHACAALIGLKNANSPKLTEHALGYLAEQGIRDVAKSTLTEAEIGGLDDYLMSAYAVTNPAKQRVLLKIIAARNPEGADRFLNEARHNASPMVRFTAAHVLGDVPSVETFEMAVASAPLFDKTELANTYFKLAVTEQRSGSVKAARDMAHALVNRGIESRIREGAFGMIEKISSAESAPVLHELIGAAYQPKDGTGASEDPFDGDRKLAIAAGRAYVAAHAAAAKEDPDALEEIANVSENAAHAEVSNFAEEKLFEFAILDRDASK